ncbi:two-component system chemotaxis response regulator CheY [Desulfitispora alkaliphila]|uniref:response regulator n=1 Tax=Desulfitispora alkaliphila TaxID=622674 RepID=UPI003D24BFC3
MKFLIIEDSILYRKTIVKFLKKYFPDAEYILAENGAKGYDLHLKENPDVTFLDLLLPEITGQEVLRLIKEYNPNAKVVVLSADVQKLVKAEVHALGVVDFINKPLTEEKVEVLIPKLKGELNA